MSRADRGGVSCLSQIVDRDSRDTENRSGDAARRRDDAREPGRRRDRDRGTGRGAGGRTRPHARVRNRPRGRTERDASLRPLPRVAANRVPAVGLAAYPPPPYSSAEGCAPPCADGKEAARTHNREPHKWHRQDGRHISKIFAHGLCHLALGGSLRRWCGQSAVGPSRWGSTIDNEPSRWPYRVVSSSGAARQT